MKHLALKKFPTIDSFTCISQHEHYQEYLTIKIYIKDMIYHPTTSSKWVLIFEFLFKFYKFHSKNVKQILMNLIFPSILFFPTLGPSPLHKNHLLKDFKILRFNLLNYFSPNILRLDLHLLLCLSFINMHFGIQANAPNVDIFINLFLHYSSLKNVNN